MLITPADHWFSLCVRTRTDWTCEHCGKKYEDGARGLHCSHYFSRGNWAVRFNPLNASAHCFYCHEKLGNNPDLFHAWMESHLLLDKMNNLRLFSQRIDLGKEYRRTKGKGEIAAHFKAEYERMLQERSRGVIGRIEFHGWTG